MAEGAALEAARNDWFGERIAHALHAKPEKFKKLMQQEEGSRPMLEFLVNPECTRVFLSEGGKNEFVCFETPPANQKKKIVYFLKLQKVALSAENVAGVVVHGDLCPGAAAPFRDNVGSVPSAALQPPQPAGSARGGRQGRDGVLPPPCRRYLRHQCAGLRRCIARTRPW